jgi:hypothetical protein
MARFRESTRYTIEEIQAKAQEDAPYALLALAVRPAPHPPPRDRRGALESHGRQHLRWDPGQHLGILHRPSDPRAYRSQRRAPVPETFASMAKVRQGSTAKTRASDMLQNSGSLYFARVARSPAATISWRWRNGPNSLPTGRRRSLRGRMLLVTADNKEARRPYSAFQAKKSLLVVGKWYVLSGTKSVKPPRTR